MRAMFFVTENPDIGHSGRQGPHHTANSRAFFSDTRRFVPLLPNVLQPQAAPHCTRVRRTIAPASQILWMFELRLWVELSGRRVSKLNIPGIRLFGSVLLGMFIEVSKAHAMYGIDCRMANTNKSKS